MAQLYSISHEQCLNTFDLISNYVESDTRLYVTDKPPATWTGSGAYVIRGYNRGVNGLDPADELIRRETSDLSETLTIMDDPYISGISTDDMSCEPGGKIRIIGFRFGETQGDSVVHIGPKTYDSTSAKIKLWTDTKIKVKIPNYQCDWFKGKDFRRRKVWVTVDLGGGNLVDSNSKILRVAKPHTCGDQGGCSACH